MNPELLAHLAAEHRRDLAARPTTRPPRTVPPARAGAPRAGPAEVPRLLDADDPGRRRRQPARQFPGHRHLGDPHPLGEPGAGAAQIR